MAIDWDFLSGVENRRDAEGNILRENTTYVPKQNGKAIQNSGVTIGSGIDLGQQTAEGLRKIGVPEDIVKKLDPFFEKSQDEALAALEEHGPVTLTLDELDFLERPVKRKYMSDIRRWYNRNNTQDMDFSDLTDKQQTVLLSVYWNHGDKALKKYNFGKQVANNEWDKVADNLRNFYGSPDNELHSRRIKELQYLTGASVDGVAGNETDTKLEEFKTAFQQQGRMPSLTNQPVTGTSLRDVRPNTEDTRGPLQDLMTGFLDNLTAAIGQRLQGPQSGSQEPSQARTEPQQPKSRMEALIERGAMGLKQSIHGGENALERTYREVMLEEEAEEAQREEPSRRRLSLIDRAVEMERTRRARGTKETQPPVRVNRGTMEERDDSKDPTYGLF